MGVIETTIRLNDAFSGTLRKLESGLSAGTSGFDRLKGALSGGNMFGNATKQSNGFFKSMVGAQVVGSTISKGMALAGSGIRSMVGELNESTVAWDTFDGNMRQIGKTPAQIASARASMQQFAQATIYSSSDMASTYSQLAAIGTKNTGQLVKGFAGLAASATDPKQAMKTLSEQATQMAAKPMVQWQDLKLMMEQAPAGMSAVAKKMHMTTAQLIANSQGKNSSLKSADLLKAIAEVGTNANFSKMATQYKTVGQAADGLRETLANKLQPQFKKFSQIGIDAISKLSDKLSDMNFDSLADKVLNVFDRIKSAFSDVTKGFEMSGAGIEIKKTLQDIGSIITDIMTKASSGGNNNFFTQLGSFAGSVVSGVANTIDGIARALGQMNPATLEALGAAFIILKSGMKGLVFTAVVAGLRNISRLNPGQIKQVAKAIQIFAGALVALKAIKGVVSGISLIGSAISSISEIMEVIGPAIEAGLGAAIGTIAAVLGVITIVIFTAVWAWQNNFLGFHDFISNLFSNLGAIFEPFRQAIGNLGNALAPVGQLLGTIGMIIAGAIVGSLYLLAGAVAVVVDLFSMLIDIVSIVIFSFRFLVDAINVVLQALRDLFTLNWSFSNARNAINQVKSDVNGLKDTFSNLGNIGKNGATAGFINALSNIDSKAKTTQSDLNGIKVPDIALSNARVLNMNNVAANKAGLNKKVKVGYQFDTDPLGAAGLKNPAVKLPVKADTSKLNSTQQAVQSKLGSKPIKMKVATSKVPTPKAPKMKTIKAKVAKPKIPTPKVPKLKTLHVKVARPVIPQPKMPKIKTITAPHISNISMAGSVSAVRSGMNQAVAAVRSGGNRMVAAVHSAITRSVAVARSGAGAMRSAGVMIGAGLAAGMRSEVGAVAAAANALVAQANRAARAKAQIHSPSRLFAEVGSFIGQGMALGMNKTAGLVGAAGAGLIDAANTGGTVGVNYAGSGSITPASLARSQVFSNRSSNSNSQVVTIAKGAIVVNGASKPQQTADDVIDAIEERMVEIDNRRL
ncbi:tape measure protein [Lactobacillus sp. ESL0731]|uniref:tape measure protein n=1 Tax=unclassified Lactobacillus TaxID=2620435 RepID=UPI0023F8447B|nr:MULTISPECIES: tape measure protein [unclassified Lactobacillus]WEV51678.1 tape measure protein [Lactobacillus sp. ESL0700]WEV62807.1 tape measure protein [Lactobacillus sp. ESL0731]